MQIMCVDHSPWGLMELEHTVKQVMPKAAVHGCRDPGKAIELAHLHGCDILLIEIDLGGPKWEGLDFAEEIKKVNPRVNIIFVTDLPEREYAKEVVGLRISGYVRKPYGRQELAEEFAHLRYAQA